VRVVRELVAFLASHDGINDKARLTTLVAETFSLTRDRSVFYCDDFAIRFSTSRGDAFSNTVLSLSNLRKVDHTPFLVCVVTPTKNRVLLANSTLLRKISHSSQQLRLDNIRGSFNGSDIVREFEGIRNEPTQFERLFAIHAELGFEGNLARLVDATNNIAPTGRKYAVSGQAERTIIEAPDRALQFVASPEAQTLKRELDDKVNTYRNEIVVAALIENVNVRGRVIEYLIAGEDEQLRQEIISAIRARMTGKGLPAFKTENHLGDYRRVFPQYLTETDVKTKVMVLASNPKAYNLDKMLEFLSTDNSVFMFYFVGVDPTRVVNTVLVSMFQKTLLRSTILLKHWAGRNSRGVSQFDGKAVSDLILNPNQDIATSESREFLRTLIAL